MERLSLRGVAAAQCNRPNVRPQSVFLRLFRTGLRLRGALMAAVHRKSLKITSESKRSSNLGEIVNLMSVDAQRINDFMIYVHLLWYSVANASNWLSESSFQLQVRHNIPAAGPLSS